MKTQSLSRQIALVLCVFLAFNLFLKIAGRNSPPRHLLRDLSHAPHFDIVFLGNSLMAAGMNTKAFHQEEHKRGLQSELFNMALGATSPLEHLILLKRTVDKQSHFQTLVYGFFDMQLTEPVPPLLEGNRGMSYYTDPVTVARYYAKNQLESAGIIAQGKIPYLTERSTLWSKVELVRRKIGQYGMPPANTNSFGRVGDFTALEASSTEQFRKECHEAVTKNLPLDAPVLGLIQLARKSATHIVIVEMPMPSRHRNLFYLNSDWDNYRSHVKNLTALNGAVFLDASSWLDDDNQFADALHLNAAGADIFSRRLADELLLRHLD